MAQTPNGTPAKGSADKPFLLFASAPFAGHAKPLLRIATEMGRRGYQLAFYTGEDHGKAIEQIGEFYPMLPHYEEPVFQAREKLGIQERMLYDLENIFMSAIPPRTKAMRSILEDIRKREPGREVIIINESCSYAVEAFMHGAPGPEGYDEFPKTICVNVVPLPVPSIDLPPFGPGFPPDSTPEGREKNKAMHEQLYAGPMKHIIDVHHQKLAEAGVTQMPKKTFFETMVTSYDVFYQMCSPSLEYPRSDLHHSIRFCGALPPPPIKPDYVYPEWWPEITANAALAAKQRKKVVFAAQGTIAVNYGEIVIPTIQSLADRDDVITIVTLGIKDARLPADVEIPANTKVIDYLLYEAILPYTDVFVTNGGYGGVMHAVNWGVPMVVSGLTEDKAEVSGRAEYAGLAINLRAQTPSSQQIREAVEKVLGEPKYKSRAEELREENLAMDAFGRIEKQVIEFTKGR